MQSWQCHIAVYFLYLYSQNSLALTQTLTTSDQNTWVNGASITNLSPATVRVHSNWHITVHQDTDQWSLWLKTNDKWGFDASLPSSFSIELSGRTDTSPSDLLISFTDNADTKYFTILIRLNGQSAHVISPGCGTLHHPTQRFMNGNVYLTMADEPTPGNRMCRPAYINSSHNCSYGAFGPAAIILWPMTFTLRNYPAAGYSTITFASDGYPAVYCAFGEVFPRNIGTSVWITTFVSDNIEISSIRLDYTVSAEPTTEPSDHSTNPTKHDTPAPSNAPSIKPSLPDISTCGDTLNGPYNGRPLVFLVRVPYDGSVQFDATGSSFAVTAIEAFTKLNVLLEADLDNDEIVWLRNIPAAVYKFMIGGTQNGTYQAQIRCISYDPTLFPTRIPTNVATINRTSAPLIKTTAIATTTYAVEDGTSSDEPHLIFSMIPESVVIAGVMALIAAVLLCCMCTCCCVCYERVRKRKRKTTDETAAIEMMDARDTQPIMRMRPTVASNVLMAAGEPQTRKDDRVSVEQWMKCEVGLPQYVHLFANNGYGSLRAIESIESCEELRALGIVTLGHQRLILSEIIKLKNMVYATKTESAYSEGPKHQMYTMHTCMEPTANLNRKKRYTWK